MRAEGLREVTNPSEILISPGAPGLSGVALGATLEGNRPLILEVQALVSPTTYGNPQRSTTGYDYKRLMMLLAVVEKRLGIRLSKKMYVSGHSIKSQNPDRFRIEVRAFSKLSDAFRELF